MKLVNQVGAFIFDLEFKSKKGLKYLPSQAVLESTFKNEFEDKIKSLIDFVLIGKPFANLWNQPVVFQVNLILKTINPHTSGSPIFEILVSKQNLQMVNQAIRLLEQKQRQLDKKFKETAAKNSIIRKRQKKIKYLIALEQKQKEKGSLMFQALLDSTENDG